MALFRLGCLQPGRMRKDVNWCQDGCARMRSVVKSSIGAGKTSPAKNETTHRYCCSSHTHDTPAQHQHQHQHQPAPTLCCLCPRRTANSSVACCVRPLPGVYLPTADSPLRAQALRAQSPAPHASYTATLHTEETLQHTASNVGTPQCPAFWPCQPRLSLSTPFPEEPSTTRPTDSFFCSTSNPGTAHADLSFPRISVLALCSP